MSKEFRIVAEGEYPASPDRVWEAVTTAGAAWLFPTDGMVGEELVVERPRHHINRMEGPDGWFNELEQVIEDRPGGRAYMRWVHSGVLGDEDWETQYDGASKHTSFYLHTLSQYLEHFDGRPVVFADIQGSAASALPDGFDIVRTALGITADSAVGDTLAVTLPGRSAPDAVIDYVSDLFVGLRTDDALLRFFGRNAFGAPVGITVHHFGEAESEKLAAEWKAWFDGLYVGATV